MIERIHKFFGWHYYVNVDHGQCFYIGQCTICGSKTYGSICGPIKILNLGEDRLLRSCKEELILSLYES